MRHRPGSGSSEPGTHTGLIAFTDRADQALFDYRRYTRVILLEFQRRAAGIESGRVDRTRRKQSMPSRWTGRPVPQVTRLKLKETAQLTACIDRSNGAWARARHPKAGPCVEKGSVDRRIHWSAICHGAMGTASLDADLLLGADWSCSASNEAAPRKRSVDRRVRWSAIFHGPNLPHGVGTRLS
jgi:hypothetical protein